MKSSQIVTVSRTLVCDFELSWIHRGEKKIASGTACCSESDLKVLKKTVSINVFPKVPT